VLDLALIDVLELILVGKPLPAKYRDHPLSGDWSDHRDCHLKPDLLLIYRLMHRRSSWFGLVPTVNLGFEPRSLENIILQKICGECC